MNEFIYRGPLAPNSPLFKGREFELRKLTQLCTGEVKAYGILYGGRQTGKTSLLNQFEGRLKVPSVRVDFQLSPGGDSAQAYAYIAQRVDAVLGVGNDFVVRNGPDLTDYFCSRLSDPKFSKLVLLIEELGALPERTRDELANLFRAIFTNRYDKSCQFLSKLVVIFVGNIELYNLASKDVSPLGNICEKIYLSDLNDVDAASLIEEGLSASGMQQEQITKIANAIYEQIDGHPYLTQRFGAFVQDDVDSNKEYKVVVAKASRAVLVDDPLLDHLKRMVAEFNLTGALGSLLKSDIKFSRTDEEMVKLDILGFVKERNNFWCIRNSLIQEIVVELLKKKPVVKPKKISASRTRKPKVVKAFVSSTWVDLQSERELVEKALHRLIDTNYSGMEYFGSQEDTPLKVSLRAVDESDIYVGIFAHRYGSGITEKEYRRARKNGLPCLIYLKDEDVPVKPAFIEQKLTAKKKMISLKVELKKNHVISIFRTPEELASKVTADLHNYLHTK